MMINGKTRKIEELIVKYKKHLDLKDIYVEGEKDVKFFRLIFKKINVKINVYKISTIYVPQKIADDLGLGLKLTHSCRNKIITLSYALIKKLSNESLNQCHCVADKDFDPFLDNNFSNKILLYTDYNCIEMYVFNELSINKFIELGLCNFPISANNLISEFEKVLPIMFLFRLTNESLKLNLEWKNFIDNCICSKCKIKFDFDIFLQKFFNQNRLNKQKQVEFIDEFEKNRKKLTEDVRNQIHKDDFRELFIKFIRVCGKVSDFNKKSSLFPLMMCIELNDIKNEELINSLIEWANN